MVRVGFGSDSGELLDFGGLRVGFGWVRVRFGSDSGFGKFGWSSGGIRVGFWASGGFGWASGGSGGFRVDSGGIRVGFWLRVIRERFGRARRRAPRQLQVRPAYRATFILDRHVQLAKFAS